MLARKNRYFEIIREDIIHAQEGEIEYDPYDVSREHKKYANYGAIELLDFGLKSDNHAKNLKKDRWFQKRYEKAKAHITHEILHAHPLLETYICDELSYSLLSPFLRNLTYGKSLLSVWIHEGETYALVYAGKGKSACNLLFYCRIENPKD